MLIEFTASNFRSLSDPVTLSLIATALDSKDARLGTNNVIPISKNLSLLRSAVIYGANASGKSNIIKAFSFFHRFVANSARESVIDDPIATEPYLLRDDTRQQPSMFEAVFLIEGIQYRYGFEVTTEKVVSEWLYYTPNIRESTLFTRDEQEIRIPSHSAFREGRGLEARLRPNALFLSVVAQFNGEVSKQLLQWFARQTRVLTASNDRGYINYTRKCIEQGTHRLLMDRLIRELDLGIIGLSVHDEPLSPEVIRMLSTIESGLEDNVAEVMKASERTVKRIQTRHVIRDKDNMAIREEDFSMDEMESEGTRKLIALCGPLFDVLTAGRTLFLDEIDSRLHPLITSALVRLFHSKETNPQNAQLICATHDTNLLDRRIFRRDQIFFTEKASGSTKLYSLADFKLDGKRVRTDASFEQDYIQGRYGAVPYLGDLRHLFAEELLQELDADGNKEASAESNSGALQ